jgi:hypothetical protein
MVEVAAVYRDVLDRRIETLESHGKACRASDRRAVSDGSIVARRHPWN